MSKHPVIRDGIFLNLPARTHWSFPLKFHKFRKESNQGPRATETISH
ncbi:hypothetical protein D3OALGB2SA_2935 [Olavius algarvensis associated proteobacterium Delta 3]|nr:hypothetical protein D3OALGB2SA_2935 [Olavius algarvensis associated proteobacterium Delta 3]